MTGRFWCATTRTILEHTPLTSHGQKYTSQRARSQSTSDHRRKRSGGEEERGGERIVRESMEGGSEEGKGEIVEVTELLIVAITSASVVVFSSQLK